MIQANWLRQSETYNWIKQLSGIACWARSRPLGGAGGVKESIWLLLMAALIGGCAVSAEKEFVSDGCSLFPDGSFEQRDLWLECCVAHDRAYWAGGAEEARKTADIELRDCVLDTTGNEALAELMYAGVRAGGQAYFPTHYRWGYGKPYEPVQNKD